MAFYEDGAPTLTLRGDPTIWIRAREPLKINSDLSVPFWCAVQVGEKEETRVLCDTCHAPINKAGDLKRHHRRLHGATGVGTGPYAKEGAKRTRKLPAPKTLVGHERASAVTALRGSEKTRTSTASSPHASEPTSAPVPMDVDLEAPGAMPPANGNVELGTFTRLVKGNVEWQTSTPTEFANSGLAVIENFPAILCTECRLCVAFNHALGHLKDTHHFTSLSSDSFGEFVQRRQLDVQPKDILTRVKAARQFEECPWLAQKPGWWCEECGYATPSRDQAIDHQRRPPHVEFGVEKIRVNGEDHMHQRAVVEGVIQTLFASNRGGYIPSIPIPVEGSATSASDVFREVLKVKQDLFEPAIVAQNNPALVHPFIRVSSFQQWIDTKSWQDVEELQQLMKAKKFAPWGPRLVHHCEEMMRKLSELCVPGNYGARCQVNSPSTVIQTTPFGALAGGESQERYIATWAGFIAYLINCFDYNDGKRYFGLSSLQHGQLEIYKDLVMNSNSAEREAVEALVYLSACLFCHEFTGENTDHPLIAFTILSSIKPGNIIANPKDISPFLARLEYFCRVTTMVFADICKGDATFYAAVRSLCVWVKEGENTPFAWIRQMLHLTASFVHGTNQMPRFVWGLDDSKSYTYGGFRIYVQEFVSLVRGSVQEAVDSFFQLWSSYGLPDSLLITSLDDVDEDLASRSTHYNFARNPVNFGLQTRAAECLDKAINSEIFCHKVRLKGEDLLVWHPNHIRARLAKSKLFLRSLAVALYLGSGQPPRGTELMSTLITNINTRVRNTFISNGRIILCHFLNKTTFLLKSDKAIVRELCSVLSLVVANYIALLRPLESKLAAQVEVKEADVAAMQQQLFHFASESLTTPVLSGGLKHEWCKAVTRYGPKFEGWGTGDTRQNSVYVCKRYVQMRELGEDGEPLFDLQAGHCSAVAKNWYGVEGNRLGGDIDPALLEQFRSVSRAHHKAYDLESLRFERRAADLIPSVRPHPSLVPTAGPPRGTDLPPSNDLPAPSNLTHPPSSSATHATANSQPSNSQPALSMQNHPVVPAFDEQAFSARIGPILEDTLAKAFDKLSVSGRPGLFPTPKTPSLVEEPALTGPMTPSTGGALSTRIDPAVFVAMKEIVKGRFRSVEQAAAVQAAWERKNHLLAILATGGGKTLVAEVTTRLERSAGMLNVIMVPLKALADDLKARFTKGRVMVETWRGPDTPRSQVLIAIFEDAGKRTFIDYLKAHMEKGTLGRIFVDECHYPVFGTPDFRPGMRALAELVILGAQLVLLTATAPPVSTGKLLEFYGVPHATIIRGSTNRPNIRYEVTKLPTRSPDTSEVRYTYLILKLYARKGNLSKECQMLVYLPSKQLIDEVLEMAKADPEFQEAPWVKYHANMTPDEKTRALRDWVTVMLASPAFGVGVNPLKCGWVVHFGAPPSMLDYVQESGRAGRDGQRASAVLLWDRKPRPHVGLGPGETIMASYIESTLCYRQIIFRYMDGTAADCFSLSEDNELCTNCRNTLNATISRSQQALPPPREVGQLVSSAAAAASAASFPELLKHVVPWVEAMDGRCVKCYIEGRRLKLHKCGIWNCPTGRFSKIDMDPYSKKWKLNWYRAKTGNFSVHMCTLCWLPTDGDAYHDPDQLPRCKYIDSLGHLAWAVFHNKDVMEEFKRAHPAVEAGTLDDWGRWISSPNTLRAPRFWDLAIWVDRRNASFSGRVVLIR